MINTGQPNQPIYKKIDNYIFKFNDMLGQGNFSKVYRGINQKTNEAVAIKVIELNSLKSKKLQQLLFSQIDVLKKLNHSNVLKCYQVFTSNRNCYIITQVCNGGDLQTKLRKYHHFTQSQAQPYIMDIFKGLRYLAQNHVIHRDLKVANVFLHNGIAKIADFGFAKFTKDNFKDINIGSPIYMSPQGFIENIYGPKTDVWAFGILIYQLFHGKTPYSHCNNQTDLRRQIRIPISFSSLKSDLSFEIRDIIIKCLQVNQQKRISISKLQQQPYFKRLLKMDIVALGGRKNNLHTPPGSNQVSRSTTPNNPNVIYQPRSQTISNSLQKNNRFNVKSFLGNLQNQEKQIRFKSENRMLNSPSSNNRGFPINFEQKFTLNRNNYASPFRVDTTQNNKYKNTTSNPAVYSANPVKKQQGQIYNKPRVQSTYLTSWQNVCLPGIINFKQAVNILHYCRLIYKFLIMSRQVEQNDNKLFTILSAQMFKFLGQISQKIQKRQISYDQQNNKKEQKLRQVSNEYYRKYSLDIEKPSNKQITNQVIIIQVKHKIQQYESIYIHKGGILIYVYMLHFLIIILQATQLLSKCVAELRYRDWAQYTYIEDFLCWNKNKMSYETFLDIKQRLKI